ncbi:uncharacterized protein CC84DRAFT_886247 [Paraphaeosphaeria sporulosa]|uniref:Uncharacterized protein n=1 Tax=Paraphaeosphaeria sporulosa TaxID=1460663 RepID=A0A177C9K8_9PLEO|nr:uncharacterized protein CC84DRAFT_886247 [Paraphaeosphaeria sporulosa]OAG04066.1 hypothetical protein CC84DRAFT_886247 [Paraphaeosphaeria sporulosa]
MRPDVESKDAEYLCTMQNLQTTYHGHSALRVPAHFAGLHAWRLKPHPSPANGLINCPVSALPSNRGHTCIRNSYDTYPPRSNLGASTQKPIFPVWLPRLDHLLSGYVASSPTHVVAALLLFPNSFAPVSYFRSLQAYIATQRTGRGFKAAVFRLFRSKSRTRKSTASMRSPCMIWTFV